MKLKKLKQNDCVKLMLLCYNQDDEDKKIYSVRSQ